MNRKYDTGKYFYDVISQTRITIFNEGENTWKEKNQIDKLNHPKKATSLSPTTS